MKAPKVTVIVINYNHDRYILNAVDSILNQTFSDFEIIIVDDGSKDNSIDIITGIVKKYPGKIKFLFHKNHRNLGISNSYQLAISNSKGEYIAFLEADDFWSDNFLEKKVKVLDNYSAVGVVFSRYKVLSESFYGYDMTLRQAILGIFIKKNRPFNNLISMLGKNNIATFSAFMTRKKLLTNISLDLRRDIFCFDWWVLIQLSSKTNFFLDDKSIIYWRHHKKSTMGKQKFDDHKRMLKNFIPIMYDKIDQEFHAMSNRNKIKYCKKKCMLPLFMNFYLSPDVKNFFTFFRHDPTWAIGSMASYIVNYLKYS